MDFARLLREQVRRAVDEATKGQTAKGQAAGTSVNIASAINVDGSGHTTSVYSDGDVTVIRRDGKTRVIHHDEDDPQDDQ
jgi:hypothetical protein